MHAGFRLWSHSDFIENRIDHYVLRGVYNTKNTIFLRLDEDGYLPNSDGSGWLILRSLKWSQRYYWQEVYFYWR
ncbi:AfaD family invasin [Enterobacter asburiae]|uniref:AfaD family invasin n=1 Tax=Enterobacter asburiae TaxID=61645 RepID=UPI003EE50E28